VREQLKDLGYGIDQQRGWVLEMPAEAPLAVLGGRPLTNAAFKSLFSPYDLAAQPISPPLRTGLHAAAYRIDDEHGRILHPDSKTPLSRFEVAALQRQMERAQGTATLERLHAAVSARSTDGLLHPETALELQSLVAGRRGALPESVVHALEKGAPVPVETLRKDIAKAHASSIRAQEGNRGFQDLLGAATPLREEPGQAKARAYFDAQERSLGELLAEDVSAHLSMTQAGREILDGLRGADGRLRMPGFRILRTDSDDAVRDSHGAAFHNHAAGVIIVNFSVLKQRLLEQAPKGEREELEKKLAQPQALMEHFLRDGAARRRFAQDYDVIWAHELTHVRQDRKDRVNREILRGNLRDYPIEYEHEAYLAQMRYLHEKLKQDPAASADHLQDYAHFLADYKSHLDGIARQYAASGITDLSAENFEQKQATRARLLDESGEPRLFQGLKQLALAQGTLALKEMLAAHGERMKEFMPEYEAMRRAGSDRLGSYFRSIGRPEKALQWLSGKAALMIADARTGAKTKEEALQARREAGAAAHATMELLRRDGGLESLDARLDAVLAVENYSRSTGAAAPPRFARLSQQTYAEAARDYILRAWKATHPAERAAYLQAARHLAQRVNDRDKREDILRALEEKP
jgi:hypothetical protein